MNERIEGLWWAARIGYNNQSCDPEVLEKFAELIVRECCQFENSYSGDARLVSRHYGRRIREHFGVKE